LTIICSTDDNFVQHCSVMLTSVLLSNDRVTVWLLTEGLTEFNINILKNEVESKGGVFNYVEVDSEIISKLPMPKKDSLSHISPATYYRLLVSEILPYSVDKAIYLDCDIIVRGSLNELWNIDISNYAVGAVHQMWHEVEDAYRLGYPLEYGYFNAGVLLINLEYWRKYSISKKLVNYLTSNFETILMHDQDALNAVLYNKSFILPCKWNMLHFFFFPDSKTIKGVFNGAIVNEYLEYKNQLKYNRKNPIVVHYVSKPKPWQKNCFHPFVSEYFSYAKKTRYFSSLQEPNWLNLNFFIFLWRARITVKWMVRPVYSYFK
jgi:lipopolysaccharide biosynthesis glycosyltransferase